jgi:hypothetical protein
MLMDHGTPWWAPSNAAGLSTLSVFLVKQGIRLLHGRVRHPQTQGKVERFHRTLGERLRWWGLPTDLPGFIAAFAAFQAEYNQLRPHAALALTPPAAHFHPSRQAYRPHPPTWQYPVGSDVRAVDHNGMVSYDGRRFFVSEALIGEAVACRRLETRVLVVYRHMYVREWQLHTGRSQSLLRPRDATVQTDRPRA